MVKKSMPVMLVLFGCLVLPMLANAATWSLNTWVKSGGGTIVSRNLATPQTSSNGSVFKNYTTSRTVPVQVNADQGYQISAITVNGVAQTLPVASGTTYQMAGPNAQSVQVTFGLKQALSVTASANAGGTVSPASVAGIYSGTSPTTPITFTFTPSAGYSLQSVTGTNGMTLSRTLPAPVGTAVTVTIPTSYVFAGNVAIVGTFSGLPVANAGTSVTVVPNTTVTLNGSGTAGPITSYTWTQTGGPAVTLYGATTANPYFTPTVTGNYTFQLVVRNAQGASVPESVIIYVHDDPAIIAQTMCQNCHQANGIGVASNVYGGWAGSKHNNLLRPVMCYDCHTGTNAGAHPGPALSSLGSVCANCHLDATGKVPLHPVEIGTNPCVTCHNAHSTAALLPTTQSAHYNNMTSGMYPASYVTPRAVCADCHNSNADNATIRHQWAGSGHAAINGLPFIYYDFKTKDLCVRCHTATGFIAFSTGRVTKAWGVASDKTKEVIGCIACHADTATGQLRDIVPIRPYLDDAVYTNPNVGKSNICMDCHSGLRNGASIKSKLAALADFTNMAFIEPHHLAAGGTLFGAAGYHFPGRTYGSDVSHSHPAIGMNNTNATGTNGPCITCHKNETFGHAFTGTAATVVCANCHSGMDSAHLQASKTSFDNALTVLRAQLAAKGFTYTPISPFFTAKNWGSGQAGANTMGAAFNFALLDRERAAYAHNPTYAMQLVLDSIDYLDNGVIDDSIETQAIPALLRSGAITDQVAQSLVAYKSGGGNCTSCHGGSTASSLPMATNAHAAHLTGAYGPGGYLGSSTSACYTCHGNGAGQHLNGAVDIKTAAGSDCYGCHAGAPPVWTGAGRIPCTTCHAANPAVLPNGVAAPYKAKFAATGHGRFSGSNQCIACHDPNAAHISGSLGGNMRLALANDNSLCASCHNNPALVANPARQGMTSHVTVLGGEPTVDCKTCHDVHGTTNAAMIKTTINGKAIVFSNLSTGFVKTVAPFDGLCQVCHTLTNHYRSGAALDGHPTRGCLNCHSHKGVFAFEPVTGGGCDSCHGYPPVPAGFVGSKGNYSSARVEDYTGGSGAHTIAAHVKPTARPSEGWANCTVCHGNGSLNPATHSMVVPVKPSKITIDIPNRYRFNPALPLGPTQYSGVLTDSGANATGSCSNTSCHFKSSRKWSTVK